MFKNVEHFTAQDARDAYANKLEDQLKHCLTQIKGVMKDEKSVSIFMPLDLEVQAELKSRGFKVIFNQAHDQRERDYYTISWKI